MWEFEMNRRLKGTQKRGRPPISLTDLARELNVKVEKTRRMENTLKQLNSRVRDEIIEDSDLEEYEELLDSEIEYSTSSESDNGMKQIRQHGDTIFWFSC